MSLNKHHQFFILSSIYFYTLTSACQIWKASDCPQPPTADDEEIFKYGLYTREQLFKFCDKGKIYAECVNKKLQCCDLKSEHSGAVAAYEVSLLQAGWRLGKYCAGLGASSIINYKCKTTTAPPARTTTKTTTTTSTIPTCEVAEAGLECNNILGSRLQFEHGWSVREKMHWCQAVRDYVKCASKHITNCSILDVHDDVDQLWNFMESMKKQVDMSCQGGFLGCEININDIRCIQLPEVFYAGVPFDSAGKTFAFPWCLFFFIVLTCWRTR